METDVLLEDVQSALKEDLLMQCTVEILYRTLHEQISTSDTAKQ